MSGRQCCLFVLFGCLLMRGSFAGVIPLPSFRDLARFYPGYWHYGGRYHNHHLLRMIGADKPQEAGLLLHDTSALRLSYALNRVGGPHSLGRRTIRLSKFGHDSVAGRDGQEYLFHPIAYGPFMADRYGYPSVSKLHAQDPVGTKEKFWGRQGILRVITYTRTKNLPKGHVALWDCNHFHQSKDWVAGHSLLTVEFWESPDSNCSQMNTEPRYMRHNADLSGGIMPHHHQHHNNKHHSSNTANNSNNTSESDDGDDDDPSAGETGKDVVGGDVDEGRRSHHHHQQQHHHRPPSHREPPLPRVPLVVEASRPHPRLRHKHWERRFIAQHHLAQGRSKGNS